jgi:hypothetical protein
MSILLQELKFKTNKPVFTAVELRGVAQLYQASLGTTWFTTSSPDSETWPRTHYVDGGSRKQKPTGFRETYVSKEMIEQYVKIRRDWSLIFKDGKKYALYSTEGKGKPFVASEIWTTNDFSIEPRDPNYAAIIDAVRLAKTDKNPHSQALHAAYALTGAESMAQMHVAHALREAAGVVVTVAVNPETGQATHQVAPCETPATPPPPSGEVKPAATSGANAADVDKAQLDAGTQEEMEHTTDPAVARQIALDHLREDPQYYEKLKQAGLMKQQPQPQQPQPPQPQTGTQPKQQGQDKKQESVRTILVPVPFTTLRLDSTFAVDKQGPRCHKIGECLYVNENSEARSAFPLRRVWVEAISAVLPADGKK